LLPNYSPDAGLARLTTHSWQSVPSRAATALLHEESLLNQTAEVLFERVSTGSGCQNHVAHRDATRGARVTQTSDRKVGQGSKGDLFALNFASKVTNLLLQGSEKK